MLSVFLLDRFRVELNGEPLNIGLGGKSLAVLKYMAGCGMLTSSRDALIENLWPECEPAVASNRLRVAIHGLRRLLTAGSPGIGLVINQGSGYRLNPGGQLCVDADLFESSWQSGLDYERAGDRASARRCFLAGEKLYVRDYLEEDLYEDWTVLRRESLRDDFLMLVGNLAEWSLAEGDYGGCVDRCHKLLSRDPCHEGAYRMLMLAHLRRGQRLRALQWFRLCCETLERELSSLPSDETLHVYHEVAS